MAAQVAELRLTATTAAIPVPVASDARDEHSLCVSRVGLASTAAILLFNASRALKFADQRSGAYQGRLSVFAADHVCPHVRSPVCVLGEAQL